MHTHTPQDKVYVHTAHISLHTNVKFGIERITNSEDLVTGFKVVKVSGSVLLNAPSDFPSVENGTAEQGKRQCWSTMASRSLRRTTLGLDF